MFKDIFGNAVNDNVQGNPMDHNAHGNRPADVHGNSLLDIFGNDADEEKEDA